MFLVAFVRDPHYPNTVVSDFVTIGTADTLEDAMKLRKVTGDLIFHDTKLGEIVEDPSWLWHDDWYAKRAIKVGYRLSPHAIDHQSTSSGTRVI